MANTLNVHLKSMGKDTTFNSLGSSGHWLTLDSKPAVGGHEAGPTPMEMILNGLGGCMGMDVISILKKMRTPFTQLEIKVDGERREEHPKSFTKIHIHFLIHSSDADKAEKDLKRSVDLSFERYCSVADMLKKSCDISLSTEVTAD